MLRTRNPIQQRAVGMLLLATVFWGISFPVMKAISLTLQMLLPHASSWFIASSTMVVRFGTAAVIMLLWSWRSLLGITWLEAWQGLGLGLFSGLGMVLQMDGLTYTSASTSAFLTQSYCLLLPFVVAVRERRWPSRLILFCSSLVMTGVAVLAQVGWSNFRLGRGELETLISSVIFGAQILWLERPLFSSNRVSHFTLVMFTMMALVSMPVAMLTMEHAQAWRIAYSSPTVLGLTAILVLFCTLIAFVVMNRWQPFLPAPEAALIYAAEPVFASLFSLFLPAWLSLLAAVDYMNEMLTSNLILGGGLITLANVLMQISALRSCPPLASFPTTAGVPLGKTQ